jgi:hypothetical protein
MIFQMTEFKKYLKSEYWAEDGAQWYSTCPACSSYWVPSPALKKYM